MTEQRTTGEAIVDGLLAHDVDTVFGIPGVQTYPLYDALARTPQITVYGPRHEQTAAYMAFGYAQSTGRPGVFSVVPGPGVLNASAAVLSAYGASAPMVGLTSEIPSAFMGRGLGHLHEMPDQLATMRTFTKWAANISHPADASSAVTEGCAGAFVSGGVVRAPTGGSDTDRPGESRARRRPSCCGEEPDDHGRRRCPRRMGRGACVGRIPTGARRVVSRRKGSGQR
jgi:Thiamine pyrophosphate enzyme, N-terminal TPP binding domain